MASISFSVTERTVKGLLLSLALVVGVTCLVGNPAQADAEKNSAHPLLIAKSTSSDTSKTKKDASKKPSESKDEKKKSEESSSDKKAESSDEKDDKDEKAKVPIPTNATSVTTKQLVDKPAEYLGKNVKFVAEFFAYSNLALGYKPAFRDQKKYISFLVLQPNSHIPYSELKLAMPVPKEKDPKDPKNKMLGSLKDGDTIEVIGKVFSTALDEPWVDVLDIKRLKQAKSDEDDESEEEESDTASDNKSKDSKDKKKPTNTKKEKKK